MSPRNDRNRRARSRSPLRPGHHSTSYGSTGPVPPPYSPTPDYPHERPDGTDIHPNQWKLSLPSHATMTKWFVAGIILFFLIVPAEFVSFIFISNLPTKLRQYNEERSQLREQQYASRREAKHLESERIALRDESTHLEKERMELDSSTLKMKGERLALESAIRHSEQERTRFEKQKHLLEAETSRLEKQKHLLENERISLERQESMLREERERLERARDEQTIPKGAFWETPLPAYDCRAFGEREYWAYLRNIPEDRDHVDACMNMPVEIKGVAIRRPSRCEYRGGVINGFWMVDWDQPDCKPWYQNFIDRGCTNWGSGLRRIEAEIVGINDKGGQDWRLLCESTPMTWDHITYKSPAHCEDRGRKFAAWDVPDVDC